MLRTTAAGTFATNSCQVFVRELLLHSMPGGFATVRLRPFVTMGVRGAGTTGVANAATRPAPYRSRSYGASRGRRTRWLRANTHAATPLSFNEIFGGVPFVSGDQLEFCLTDFHRIRRNHVLGSGLLPLSELATLAAQGAAIDRWVPITLAPGVAEEGMGGWFVGQTVGLLHVIVRQETVPPSLSTSGPVTTVAPAMIAPQGGSAPLGTTAAPAQQVALLTTAQPSTLLAVPMAAGTVAQVATSAPQPQVQLQGTSALPGSAVAAPSGPYPPGTTPATTAMLPPAGAYALDKSAQGVGQHQPNIVTIPRNSTVIVPGQY